MFYLGWLIAAIEGEGTIGCHKSSASGTHYTPVIKVYNTDMRFIEQCARAFAALDIPIYISKSQQRPPYRPCYSVTLGGWKRLSAHLPKLLPYFTAKRAQAEILTELVSIREKTPMTHKNQRREWGPVEKHLIRDLSELNRRGKTVGPSETTRETRNMTHCAEDIVQTTTA